MKVLVIGSGGREHAIVWALKRNPQVTQVFCAPGNAGIAELATCVPIAAKDIEVLCRWAIDNTINFTIVGPEDPLVLGIVDLFEKNKLDIFGPSAEAARLEGSKAYMKAFLKKYDIPTAEFDTFSTKEDAWVYIQKLGAPIVVKTDGLAAGKGVFVCMTLAEAADALDKIFDQRVFGVAGQTVVIEEFLQGEEVSILAFCDGKRALIMDASQDHKRVFDGDQGPNTGGMGAYCPAPVMTEELYVQVRDEVFVPTLHGMYREGAPYRGILYAGIMLTADGPKVLEFNVRFGDPETQVVLPRLKSDLLSLCQACSDGNLAEHELAWDARAAVCVVLAASGYPGDYAKGKEITVNPVLKKESDVVLFHAGTILKEGRCVSNGGRVLGLTAYGPTIKDAIDKAYQTIPLVSFEGMFYRKDIGHRALKS